MKTWEDLKTMDLQEDEVASSLPELYSLATPKIGTWEQLGAKKDPFEGFKDHVFISEKNVQISLNTDKKVSLSELKNNILVPDEKSSDSVVKEPITTNTNNEVVCDKKDTVEFDINTLLKEQPSTMESFNNNNNVILAKIEEEIVIVEESIMHNNTIENITELTATEVSPVISNIGELTATKVSPVISNANNISNWALIPYENAFSPNNEIEPFREIPIKTPEHVNTILQLQEPVIQPHSVENISTLYIKFPKHVASKKIDYFDIINNAVQNALNAEQTEKLSTERLPVPEIPSLLLENKRIIDEIVQSPILADLDEADTTVQIPDLNNSTIVPEPLYNSPDTQESLNLLNMLLEETESASNGFSSISKAGIAISAKGQKIVENVTNLELWHNTGFWLSIFAVIATGITYIAYVSNIPFVKSLVDKILFFKTTPILKDLTPSQNFSTNNPITIHNNSNTNLWSSLLNSVLTGIVGLSAFMGKKGIYVTQKIIRKGKW